MNDATRKMLYFKQCAAKMGCLFKVAGDHAFSSRPMGMGKYYKLISTNCLNEIVVCYTPAVYMPPQRNTWTIPDDFMPELNEKD